METPAHNLRAVRYEPEERPRPILAFGLAFQAGMPIVAAIVLTPAIVVRAAGMADSYLSWSIFTALAISGVTTVLQARRVGYFGAGYTLFMGTSGTFIAVCVTALADGGPALLATLVVISSSFQFLFAARLSLLRRIFTPTVIGTVLMLIPATVMPVLYHVLQQVPAGAAPAAAPASAAATLIVVAVVTLRGAGVWRLWAPVIGITVGCVAAGAFGLYDIGRVVEAPWIAFSVDGWPGFDFGFSAASFWSLLPAFVLVTLAGAAATVGDGVAIQNVSWRTPRAIDFRAVQGAVLADGVGQLLSGLAGTVPSTTSSSSVAITDLTGVAARRVGVCTGIIFVAVAFVPKVTALITAIPTSVAAGYLTALMAILFVNGMKLVVQNGIDHRKGLVAGVGFWIGVGFQHRSIFPDYGGWWSGLLENGMTVGAVTAILLTLCMDVTTQRHKRLKTEVRVSAVRDIHTFLADFSARRRWDQATADRLCLAAEETLLTLIGPEERQERVERRLLLVVRDDGTAAELEFIASTDEENIEDRLALLRQQDGVGMPVDHELSLRLLGHFASSVRHQQYHDTDIVTIRVDVRRNGSGAVD